MSDFSCCLTKTFHEGEIKGEFTELFGLNCYISGNKESKKIYLFFTDIYGYDFKNANLAADLIAKRTGYLVVMPDLFNGDPVPLDKSHEYLATWFPKHGAPDVEAMLRPWVKSLKESYKPEYLVGGGFCYGARIVVDELSSEGYLDAGVVAHPSLLNPEIVGKITKPILFSCAQIDPQFTVELRHESEKILIANEQIFEMDLYSQTVHGYSIKGDMSIEAVRYAADRTFASQAAFLKRFE